MEGLNRFPLNQSGSGDCLLCRGRKLNSQSLRNLGSRGWLGFEQSEFYVRSWGGIQPCTLFVQLALQPQPSSVKAGENGKLALGGFYFYFYYF